MDVQTGLASNTTSPSAASPAGLAAVVSSVANYSGAVWTVTTVASHGYGQGDTVYMNAGSFVGNYTITVVSDTTFRITVGGSPSPFSGTGA